MMDHYYESIRTAKTHAKSSTPEQTATRKLFVSRAKQGECDRNHA